MTNTLLISEKYVKTQSNIQDNVWGDFLTPAIREAQDIELQPIIGRPLYKKILKEVEEKDVETRFKTLIEDWIQPYLLYQTIVSLIPIIGTKLGNIGTVISNDEHVQNLSSSERENLEYRYRYLADHYKSELQKYLLVNKDLYPELTSTCLNNLNLKSSNSLPLWTGGVRHGQRESTDCPDKADYADPDGRKAGYIEGGKTVSVTKNNATTTLLPSEGYDGFSSVEVEVNVPIQDKKTVEITSTTGTTTITPDEGYDGIKNVELNINAQYPQMLLKGQTLYNQQIIIDDDSITSASLKDYFSFNNVISYELFFRNFSFVNNKNENIFDGDFSILGEIDGSTHDSDYLNYIFFEASCKPVFFKINPSYYTTYCYYDIKLPKIITGKSVRNSLISAKSHDNATCSFIKIDINKINIENLIDYKDTFLINNLYIEDPDYFKNFKLNPNINSNFNQFIFRGFFFKNQNEYLNLNYLFNQGTNISYSKIFNMDYSGYYYGNIDISKTKWNTNLIFEDPYAWRNISINKIKVSEITLSDTSVNSYIMISKYWTDQQNLQDFIDALPQNTTSRSIKLSSQTMNALTDEMKATAANKNWTLTT